MKTNFKAIAVTIAVSAVSIFTVGCNPVEDVKGWVDQVFCKHETREIVEAVAPTCTEDGYTEYEKCLECGKEVTKGQVVKATGHKNVETVKGFEATCSTLGKTDQKTCLDCGEVLEEAKYIPVLKHEKKEVKEVKATCTSKGTTAGVICEHGCGYVFSGCEEIPATGVHNYKNGICVDCGDVTPLAVSELEAGVDYAGYTVRWKYDMDTMQAKIESVLNYFESSDGLDISLSFKSGEYELFVRICCGSGDISIFDSNAWSVYGANQSDTHMTYELVMSDESGYFILGELLDAAYGSDFNGDEKTSWIYTPSENDFSSFSQEVVNVLLDLIEFYAPAPVEAAA